MTPLTFGSTFAGIGGFDLAFERAGMQCRWQIENNKQCQKVLQRHWPDVERVDDVQDLERIKQLKPVDVVTGGFPCQDLSVAGKRAGLAGERSGLWFDLHSVLRLFEPRWFVGENVPGLLSSNGGWDFAVLLGGLTRRIPTVPKDGWRNSGFICGSWYSVAWRCLDARYFGLAQRRARVFIVASLGNLEHGRFGCLSCGWRFGVNDYESNTVTCPRCGETHIDKITDMLDEWAYQCHGSNVGEMGTLRAGGGDVSNGVPFIFEKRVARNGRGEPEEIVPPLKATTGSTGRGDGAPLLAFDAHTITSPGNKSNPKSGDPCHALHGRSEQTTIAFAAGQGEPNADDQSGVAYSLDSGRGIQGVMRSGVRRLTPVECCRLQGFPDSHFDGTDLSDSAMYRTLGNAVAVNVVEWIARRLVEVANG